VAWRGGTDHFAVQQNHPFGQSRKMVGVAQQQEDECSLVLRFLGLERILRSLRDTGGVIG